MSSLWTNLLFMHGHIADVDLARRLANTPAPSDRPSGKRQREVQVEVTRNNRESTAPAVLAEGGCA